MIKPKNNAALGGRPIVKKGISIMIYCVLIIDQSYYNEADKKIFIIILLVKTTFVVVPIV